MKPTSIDDAAEIRLLPEWEWGNFANGILDQVSVKAAEIVIGQIKEDADLYVSSGDSLTVGLFGDFTITFGLREVLEEFICDINYDDEDKAALRDLSSLLREMADEAEAAANLVWEDVREAEKHVAPPGKVR